MSKVLVSDKYLTNIANAIRNKNGKIFNINHLKWLTNISN